MKLENLISKIQLLDTSFSQQANKAVNQFLTLRNWLIGYYIVEFEQDGQERARYGDRLLLTLADKLKEANIKSLSYRNLNLFKAFYLAFPAILQTLSAELNPIMQTLSAELKNSSIEILQSLSDEIQDDKEVYHKTGLSEEEMLAKKMIESLSFSHITLLIPISNLLKRTFYTVEAIKGIWSVRELKRQINALLYERSGISLKPELLLQNNADSKDQRTGLVKDIYTFEFLGLPVKYAVEESDLETALLDHLREFILELGNGFCLEARQKRILIGDEYFFIDLVFYHRILKCHILIELKVEEFSHANAGQMNTYLSYYKKEIKEQDDNDPIGILMVTDRNITLVEYATAGMDRNLFVTKYMLQLPSIEKLKSFIKQEIKNL